MKSIATVISINGRTIKVGCSTASCNGCHSQAFCTNKDNSYEAVNKDNIGLAVGDLVEVEIPEKRAVFTIFMSLLFPLLMFLPGYFTGKAFSDNEIIMALTGFVFIGIGFLISYLFFRGKKGEYSPYIAKKL